MPLSLKVRGALYYFGFWGANGLYQGFLAVHFRELGLSPTQIGLAIALFPLCNLLFGPPAAAWADARQKRVAVLMASLLALALSLLGLYFARGFGGVLLGMAALGLSLALVAPLADSLIGRMASRNGLEYGRMRLWGSLSFALASSLAGLAWARVGYEAMFIVAAVATLPLIAIARTLPEMAATEVRGSLLTTLHDLFHHDRGTLLLLGSVLLMGFGVGLAAPFLGLAIQDRGGAAAMVGLLYGTIALVEIVTMRYERRLSRWLGDAGVLMLSAGLYALAYVGMALANSPVLMLACGMLVGMGFGLFFVGSVRIVDARAKAHRVSTLQSLRNGLAFGLAHLIAGPVGGALYQAQGPGTLFLLVAFVFSLTFWLLWWARGAINTLPPHALTQNKTPA
ncbi:MFS transporter [Meiothermus hypogaeus]|uniref:3-phenylpropionic acid transporter n=1 Tax=Meiothermus hypogaeus TaxID=884155 RepID=A0ABX9MPR5_9DEIN|nr:MFS transporter [Meiothermus hypogaeus]RIH80305.1 putative 3-phenylpropionic acid transporter [Meiothermus hypogaeus]